MRRRKAAFAAVMIIFFPALFEAGNAFADVTVKGKVEYWDQLRGDYFPCRNVHVEVEGDWFWFFDPDVLTKDDGTYSATVSDPPFFWGDYDDIDIEVYAETGGIIQVFSSMWSWWPYHAISHEVDNVGSGQTVTINMRIGGKANTAKESYYRTMAETANAFALYDRALDQYRTLLARGWPNSDFDEVEFIVPAASPTGLPYYNHITGFVNIALKSAGISGLGPWGALPTGNDEYSNIEDFRSLIQHEYAHNIHDEATGSVAPMGLSMPTYHSPKDETNRFVAFTEGLAYFIPIAVNNDTMSKFEPSRTIKDGITMANIPKTGDHYAMEGEVTGVLVDIFDAKGPEPCRHPAEKTADNALALPPELIDAQTWADRLSDPNLAKFRQVMRTYVNTWPVQTIGEFLDVYKNKYPGEIHALKSIAFNRDITVNMPAERPAVLTGAPTVSRFSQKLSFEFQIREPDPEDRPFVKAFLWLQKGANIIYMGQTPESSNWAGDTRLVSFGINLPLTSGPGDFLWLIVSDDMLPQAFRIDVPANMATAAIKLPDRPDLGQFVMRRDLRVLERGDEMIKVPATGQLAKAGQPSAAESKKNLSFKNEVETARQLLRDYAESREMALRQERGLYKLGRRIGDLDVATDKDVIFYERPREKKATEILRVPPSNPGVVEFSRWKTRLREGRGLKSALTSEDAGILGRYLALAEKISRESETAGREIAGVRTRLQNGLNSILTGQQEAPLAAETKRVIAELDAALAQALGDSTIAPMLRDQAELMRRIAGTTEGFVPQVQEFKPIKGTVLQPSYPDISGRWQSNIRMVYEITQKGDQFTWRKVGTEEVGKGTIRGKAVMASWSGGLIPGSAVGEIVEVDANGVAQRITWKNGVVFFR